MTRIFYVGLLMLILFTVSAGAKDRPPVGAPAAGPEPRPATPLILVFRALNPRDYRADSFTQGLLTPLVTFPMAAVSDSLYHKASARAAATVRSGFPALDVQHELRAAFRCGEADSLCTEMVVIPETSSEPLQTAIASQLQAHQWQEARLVSFWWYVDEPRLSAHVSLEHVQLMPEDKHTVRPVVLAGYYWTAPPATGAKKAGDAVVPHVEEWEPAASAPREASMLAGLAELEHLAQFALSWSRTSGHIHSLPQFRKVDDAGLQCTGLRQCNELVEGVVGDRAWVWDIQRVGVYEMESRPRIAP